MLKWILAHKLVVLIAGSVGTAVVVRKKVVAAKKAASLPTGTIFSNGATAADIIPPSSVASAQSIAAANYGKASEGGGTPTVAKRDGSKPNPIDTVPRKLDAPLPLPHGLQSNAAASKVSATGTSSRSWALRDAQKMNTGIAPPKPPPKPIPSSSSSTKAPTREVFVAPAHNGGVAPPPTKAIPPQVHGRETPTPAPTKKLPPQPAPTRALPRRPLPKGVR